MDVTRTITPIKALCLVATAALLAMGGGLLATGIDEQARAPVVKLLDEQRILIAPQRAVLNNDTDAEGLTLATIAAIGSSARVDKGRDKMLQFAYEKQVRALQKNVADPYGWVRIAYLDLSLKDDRAAALDALRLSVQSAPYEPQLMVKRAQAFYELRDLHSLDDDRLMQREWQYSFRGDRTGLVRLVKRQPALLPVVDAAMKQDDTDYVRWWDSVKKDNGLSTN